MNGTTVQEWPASCRRVVFLSRRTPETSGGASVVHTLSAALQRSGITVEHVSLEPGTRPPSFPTYVVDSRPDWHRRPAFRTTRGLRNRAQGLVAVIGKRVDRIRNRARLRRLLEGYGTDTVLVFTHVSAKVVVDETGYARAGQGPIMVGQHHSQFESIDLEPWLREAITRHFQDLDAFVALTEDDAAKFQHVLLPPCRSIANPVERASVAPRDRRPIAVAISRLSGEKALEVMIGCFTLATEHADLRDWRLDIYGEGDQRDRLNAAIKDTDTGRIRLAGHCANVDEVLADASVLLMTSWMEGLPMSILEAGAMGVPTIAFDCSPGVRSLVGQDRGFLVPPGDESEYARVLTAALLNPDDLARRGDAAHALAESLSPMSVLESWGRLLTECYASRDVVDR